MKNLYNKLTYYPVNIKADRKAFELGPTYLANAIRPIPSIYLNTLRQKRVMCDSSGLHIFTKGINEGKTVLDGSMYKTLARDPNFLVIGLLSNCMEYNRLNSSIAFCVDVPSKSDNSDFIFYSNLSESIKSKNYILKIAEHVCPITELGIVLKPRNPLEVEIYFSLIATPNVNLYAYPPGNKPKDALGNAYILSFLHSVGVKHVHFLGTSAVPVIVLLAKAIVSELFTTCTFDSLTWNQNAICQRYKFLSPETLSSIPKGQSLPFESNLL